MGWNSGAELATEIWKLLCDCDVNGLTVDHALKLVDLFEDHDCDVMEECEFVEKMLEYDEDKREWRSK